MGLPPKGEIVARPMVARACGCMQEFQHYSTDKYREERLAKFQQTRCPTCAAKLAEANRLAAPVPKGELFKLLPLGTQVTLTLGSDGTWAGTLTADGKVVEMAGDTKTGPQAIVVALARLWFTSHGVDVNREPLEPPA
jgi:hypothetical protein